MGTHTNTNTNTRTHARIHTHAGMKVMGGGSRLSCTEATMQLYGVYGSGARQSDEILRRTLKPIGAAVREVTHGISAHVVYTRMRRVGVGLLFRVRGYPDHQSEGLAG